MTLNLGDNVVDISANIGAFAVLAGSIVGPTGRVIALEPMPDNVSDPGAVEKCIGLFFDGRIAELLELIRGLGC